MGNFNTIPINRTLTSNGNNGNIQSNNSINPNNIIVTSLQPNIASAEELSITEIENVSQDPVSNSIEIATINANSVAYQKKIFKNNNFDRKSKFQTQKTIIHRMIFFGYFLLTKTFFIISIFETIIIIIILIWAIIVISYGKEKYDSYNKDLEKVIPYLYYYPITLLMIFWIILISISMIGAKYLIPYLFLPNIIASIIVSLSYLTIFIFTIIKICDNFGYFTNHFSWPIGVLLLLTLLLFIISSYFLLIKCVCFADTLRKRKTVQVTDAIINIIRKHNNFDDKEKDYDSISETFSTKSTVIVSDEFLKIPNKL
uniref:MARVEL domain-containing protein n=1 Tax=Strongyloides stercoralis TaxID=6248 RepID=A0A913I355_STRER